MASIIIFLSVLYFMRMKLIVVLLIIYGFLIVIDLYTYKGLRSLIHPKTAVRNLNIVFWFISVLVYGAIAWQFIDPPKQRVPGAFNSIYLTAFLILCVYIPKFIFIIFHVADDLLHFINRAIVFFQSFRRKKELKNIQQENKISRYKFLSQTGLFIAAIPILPMINGFIKGRFNFTIYKQKLVFKQLPKEFSGYKIVQLSDIHIGSFYGNEKEIERAFEMVNAQNPDLIVFTGDLVNNYTEETRGWEHIFSKLKAKDGIISILGNHDYGDYYTWPSKKAQIDDHHALLEFQKQVGFNLLLNEHVCVNRQQSNIVIAGVENWGLPPFRQSGDLEKALKNTSENDFIILLTHDPSHWDEQVIGKKNIYLSLSGHTHGMQFGFKWKNFEWSPASWKYPRWAGLYQAKNQFLYVNRGLGFIGMPARVGMNPEITVIELYNE